jgi:hypothetical protein
MAISLSTLYRLQTVGDLCGNPVSLIGWNSSTRDLLMERTQHGEREARYSVRPVNSLSRFSGLLPD